MEITAKMIIDSREERIKNINQYVNSYNVVCLHANIPGINKNIKESLFLIDYFNNLITNHYQDRIIKSIYFDSYDGNYYLYLFDKSTPSLKEELMILEDSILGRFIDLDYYVDSNHSLNRKNMRKCYLCNNPAFMCNRNQTHSTEELLDYLKCQVRSFLKEELKVLIKESIIEELELEPKFGLVTKNTNGSHKDMNYLLMKDSVDAFIDNLIKMFEYGIDETNSLDHLFKLLRMEGKLAEEKMMKSTNGINTYKGLIFDLGLILGNLGYILGTKKNLFNNIKAMCQGLSVELENNTNLTDGVKLYQQYQIKGARGEAESGFIHVKNIIDKYELVTKEDQLLALCELINQIDDTVLLKRCGSFENYLNIKNRFNKIDITNQQQINELNDYCIENHLSFGGSADLLICSLFIKKIKIYFKQNL